MKTKHTLSRFMCGALACTVLMLTHSAVTHAASAPAGPGQRAHAIALVAKAMPRLGMAAAPGLQGLQGRHLAPFAAAPQTHCQTCGGDGGGSAGGSSCNQSLELGQVTIFDHTIHDGTVTLFENTCASPKIVWAHTWDAYSFSSFSASLAGTPSATYPYPSSAGSGTISCVGFGITCDVSTPQLTVSPGAQYQACGTQNSFFACTDWITPQ